MTSMLNTAFSEADYRADAALVKKYAGVDLSELSFRAYSPKFTLASSMGSTHQLEQDYHKYGVPLGVSNGEILAQILRLLDSEDITLPSGPGTPLGDKIIAALSAGVSANIEISIPDRYMLQVPIQELQAQPQEKMRQTWFWLAGAQQHSL